jgi:hypothetical protein
MTAELVVPRGHTVTITESDDHSEEYPDYDSTIDCLNPNLCGGYQECTEKHEVDGVSASDGPWDCECPGDHGTEGNEGVHYPWCDEDEFEFHGILHTYRYGWNWTVPYRGCVVASADVSDDVYDIARTKGPGTYPVDDDWSDESCILNVIEAK